MRPPRPAAGRKAENAGRDPGRGCLPPALERSPCRRKGRVVQVRCRLSISQRKADGGGRAGSGGAHELKKSADGRGSAVFGGR